MDDPWQGCAIPCPVPSILAQGHPITCRDWPVPPVPKQGQPSVLPAPCTAPGHSQDPCNRAGTHWGAPNLYWGKLGYTGCALRCQNWDTLGLTGAHWDTQGSARGGGAGTGTPCPASTFLPESPLLLPGQVPAPHPLTPARPARTAPVPPERLNPPKLHPQHPLCPP